MATENPDTAKKEEEKLLSIKGLDVSNLSDDDLARIDYSELEKYSAENLEKIYTKLTEIKNVLAKKWAEAVAWEENKQQVVEGKIAQIGKDNPEAEALKKRISNLEALIDRVATLRNEKSNSQEKKFNPKNLVAAIKSLSDDLHELDEETAKKMHQILRDNMDKIGARNEFAQNSEYEDDYYEAMDKLGTRLGFEKVKPISTEVEIGINQPELINWKQLTDQEKTNILKRLEMRMNSSFVIDEAMPEQTKTAIRKRITESGQDPENFTWTSQHRQLMLQLQSYFQEKNKFDQYTPLKDRH